MQYKTPFEVVIRILISWIGSPFTQLKSNEGVRSCQTTNATSNYAQKPSRGWLTGGAAPTCWPHWSWSARCLRYRLKPVAYPITWISLQKMHRPSLISPPSGNKSKQQYLIYRTKSNYPIFLNTFSEIIRTSSASRHNPLALGSSFRAMDIS